MAVITRQLLIYAGSTFKDTVDGAARATELALGTTWQLWATSGGTFTLSVGLRGDSNFKPLASGTVTFSGNNLLLEIDEAVTANYTDRAGRFVVEASNGVDRHRVIEGPFRVDRDTA